jgi:hypothetical protein
MPHEALKIVSAELMNETTAIIEFSDGSYAFITLEELLRIQHLLVLSPPHNAAIN